MRRKIPRSGQRTDEQNSSRPPHQLIPTERLVTLAEVATALAVSQQTVLRAIQDGTLKSFKIGCRIRFFPQDVNDYVARSAMGRNPADLSAFITSNIKS